MSETSGTETGESRDLKDRYLARAARRVSDLSPEGPTAEGVDVQAIQNRIHRALEDDATHELRELVSQIRGSLEMARLPEGEGSKVVLDGERADQVMEALDRAEALVETHLDPATVRRLMVNIDPEAFDLARHLRHFLTSYGVELGADGVRSSMAEARVTADRDKVVKSLGHIALRFRKQAVDGADLVVEVGPGEGGSGALGHLGLDPPPYDREDLVEELDGSFAPASLKIDIPYVRAVLERHGGGLHVDDGSGGSLGYGFRLPAQPREVIP